MRNKIYQLKRSIIKYFAQIYADTLLRQMMTEIELEDEDRFWILYDRAAQLNAYCIVFHDIYLD